MKRSDTRILTSHVGSLPRPDMLIEINRAKFAGEAYDESVFTTRLAAPVEDVCRQQAEIGVDVIITSDQVKETERLLFDAVLDGGLTRARITTDGEFGKFFSKCEVLHTSRPTPSCMAEAPGGLQLSGNMLLKGEIMSARKKLLAVAAAVAMWAVIQPGTASAQTSGVGADGYTRFAWRGTDGSISLWQINPSFNFYNSHAYGPYAGYTPIAFSADANNNAYVLWKYSDGSISVWKVDTLLNFVTSHVYGPYTGWSARSLGAQTSGSGFRIIWEYTNGSVSVWQLDANLNFVRNYVAGPYFGWDPGFYGD
jgi:hypothetical protein